MSDTQSRFLERRKARLGAEMRQLQSNVAHWNRTHPNEEPIVIDADLTADVEKTEIPLALRDALAEWFMSEGRLGDARSKVEWLSSAFNDFVDNVDADSESGWISND